MRYLQNAGSALLSWKTFAVAGIAGVLLYADPFGKETVYKGKLDGKQMRYSEESRLFGLLGQKNELRVIHGKETYRFIDTDNPHSIEWQSNTSDEYLKDSLERFAIIGKGLRKNHTFDVDDKDSNTTLHCQKAQEFLEKGTSFYTDARKKIHDIKRAEYLKQFKNVNEFFASNVVTVQTNSLALPNTPAVSK